MMNAPQKRKTSPKAVPALLGNGKISTAKNTKAKAKSATTHSTHKKRKLSPKAQQMGYWWGIGGAGGSFILATIAKHFFGV